tara:strand:+ start:6502 stop:7680 length:1179 start_codon:yes stop_codon:yes gene_type:complete
MSIFDSAINDIASKMVVEDSLKNVEKQKQMRDTRGLLNAINVNPSDTTSVNQPILVGDQIEISPDVIIDLKDGSVIDATTDEVIGDNLNSTEQGVKKLDELRKNYNWADSTRIDPDKVYDSESLVQLSDLSKNYLDQLKKAQSSQVAYKEALETFQMYNTDYSTAMKTLDGYDSNIKELESQLSVAVDKDYRLDLEQKILKIKQKRKGLNEFWHGSTPVFEENTQKDPRLTTSGPIGKSQMIVPDDPRRPGVFGISELESVATYPADWVSPGTFIGSPMGGPVADVPAGHMNPYGVGRPGTYRQEVQPEKKGLEPLLRSLNKLKEEHTSNLSLLKHMDKMYETKYSYDPSMAHEGGEVGSTIPEVELIKLAEDYYKDKRKTSVGPFEGGASK